MVRRESPIVSISDSGSPPDETLQVSSSATIEELEIWVIAAWNSSSVMPRAAASSSSVGARWRRCSSSVALRSISRERARTERGTQSSERSSSMIEPLIRATA